MALTEIPIELSSTPSIVDGGNATAITIDSSENVGIGGNGTGNGLGVYLNKGTGANFFEASDGTKTMIAGSDGTQDFVKIGSLSAHPVGFVVGNGEKMRIDASGNVGIGTDTAAGLKLRVGGSGSEHTIQCLGDSSGYAPLIVDNAASSGNRFLVSLRINNVIKGNITSTGSVIVYGGQSDYRLKENIITLTGATDRLKQLRPKRFNFIGDTETIDGFLAHEVDAVVPVAVVGEKDAVDENGDVDAQQMDNGLLVPLLVATIQELEARLTALENN